MVISRHVSSPAPSIGAYRSELAALDPVFAIAMAKERSARFGSCREFTEQLSRYLNPDFAYADQIPFRVGAKATNPRLGVAVPTVPRQPERRRLARRRGVWVGALAGAALLIAGGVFAGTQLSRPHNLANVTVPNASTAPPTPAPNTGPFTGVYRVDFGRISNVEGEPATGAPPTTETWAVRSVCGNAGCIAAASRLTGETLQVPAMVLDQVGGKWLAVSVGSSTCGQLEGEVWEAFTLQPRPGGTFVGEATQIMTKGCANKRTVTFTRTGDVDITSLSSPGTLPARVVSPAEALHGRYHQSSVQPNGFREQNDYAVQTDCLRAGDRCMSLFHRPPAAAMAMVFGGGNWFYAREFDAPCAKGGLTHVRIVVPFLLPQPIEDPIALISGHGHEELTGAPGCGSTDVDVNSPASAISSGIDAPPLPAEPASRQAVWSTGLIGWQWKHMDISSAVPNTELEALSRRYAAAVDRRDRSALLAAFTPDATLRVERPGREPSTMTGHDEIERVIAIVSRWPRTAHLIAQGLFVVEGTSAIGEVYCTANHFGGDETQPGRNHVMHIRYLDRYLLAGDGRWRIAQRTVTVDATEDRPVGERIR